MSGHSHFRTIKAQKEIADVKRGKVFSKFGRLITIATKEGGSDPSSNIKLRGVIDQAKRFNMPKENIDRAIKKGTGELAGENLEEFSFEAFGPDGLSIIIEGITDNKNRTLNEIKIILGKYGGKLAGEGSVKWMFEMKGIIIINPEKKNKEEAELIVIDCGADDIRWQDDFIHIYTKPEDLENIKAKLEEKKLKIENSSLEWMATKEVNLNEENKDSIEKLFEDLNDNEAVQNIYSNLRG